MKKIILQGIFIIILGFLLMSGMRLAEYIFEKPAVKLFICIANEDGLVDKCKFFKDYKNNI